MRLKPLLFFLVVGSLAGYVLYHNGEWGPGVHVGAPAPDFTVANQEGRELKLSDLRGKLVFLNFWYSTCDPCIREMPDMELLNRAFKDRKFEMVPVDSMDPNWEKVTAFYQQHNLTLPAYLDSGQKIAAKYNVFKFPETFVIDRNGRVLKHYIGEEPWSSPKMLASFDALIKDQEIGIALHNEVPMQTIQTVGRIPI